MSEFRALCATCMQANADPEAFACPSCGSRRLVVIAGRRSAQAEPKHQRIRKGSTVTLDSALGPIERKVIKIAGDVLVVAREEEVRAATKAGRRPRGVGFKRKDVLPRKSPPLPRPCESLTASGKPCRNPALLGRAFCGLHRFVSATSLQDDAPEASSDDGLPLAGIIFQALRRAGFEPVAGSITAPVEEVLAALHATSPTSRTSAP